MEERTSGLAPSRAMKTARRQRRTATFYRRLHRAHKDNRFYAVKQSGEFNP
jgi:hypothetical protein